ncbi:MAG TPA: hypothetical protein VGG05_26195 [Pseudonocardiaceae bacterium]
MQLFLQRVAEDIAARETEKGKLRAEINRLRDWYKNRGHDVDATREASQAYVAQAQAYSRRVAVEARQRAELVLRDAQERADAASETAAKDYRYSGGRYAAELEEMERRVAWLRACCHAIQVQLHAATDAFTREVDKLSQFPANGAARPEADDETTSTELRVYAPETRNGWHG